MFVKISLLWTPKEKIYMCASYRTKLTLKFCSGLTIRTFLGSHITCLGLGFEEVMNPIFLNRTSYITNSWLQSSYGYQVATSTRYRETRYFRITSTHNTNSFLPGTMVPGILVSIPACLTLDTSFHSQREFKILSDRKV